MSRHRLSIVIALVTLLGCRAEEPHAGDPDAGSPDAGAQDGGPDTTPDGGSPDGGDGTLWRDHSPHGDTILFANTVWGLNENSPESDVQAAAHASDIMMSGPQHRIYPHNPAAMYMPYELLFTVVKPQHNPNSPYVLMEAWYADPAHNTQGYRLEDAFLHTALPKTLENRLQTVSEGSPGGWWYNPRWIPNPLDPGFIAFKVYHFNLVLAQPHHNSIFIDEADSVERSVGSVEVPDIADVRQGWVDFLTQIRPQLGNAVIMGNPAGYWWYPRQRDLWMAGGGVHLELNIVWNRDPLEPGEDRWNHPSVHYLPTTIVKVAASYSYSAYEGYGWGPGNHTTAGNRGWFAEYCWVLIAHRGPGMRDYYAYSGHAGGHPDGWHGRPRPWEKVNLGQPLGGHLTRFHHVEGATDPAGQTVRVTAREFDNGLVLMRTHVYGTPYGDFSDGSAYTFAMPEGAWYRLLDDGTVEPTPTTQFALRVWEGAIFMRSAGR
jgi:hypothetical protein